MSRRGAPRRHVHLSRDSIARAGLAIVDEGGLESLSLRRLANALGVGTMTLYQYIEGREDLVSAIVGLLLDEIDLSPRPGDTWDESVRRVAGGVRAMALRHPHAFAAVAVAPVEEPPVSDYARRIMEMHEAQGLTAHQFLESWNVIDAFLTGFLMMETARPLAGRRDAEHGHDEFDEGMAAAHSERAFGEALEVVLRGLRSTYDQETAPGR